MSYTMAGRDRMTDEYVILGEQRAKECMYCDYKRILPEYNYCPMCGRKVIRSDSNVE